MTSPLAKPAVIEQLAFETILAELMADAVARFAAAGIAYDVGNLEFDPVKIVLEAAAYRETLLRARVNDAARANLLSFAAATDLDHLAGFYDVVRLDGETDTALRERVVLAIQGRSAAGPEERYASIARAVDPRIVDVRVYRVAGGPALEVALLTSDNNGVPDAALKRDISAREPTAKHQVFVDPFTDDRYRDAGEARTAAIFDGTCQIAIDPAFKQIALDGPETLDYTDEVIVRQEFATACQKVNPYQVFSPLPLAVTLTPAEDFWEETNDIWLSPITRVFGSGNRSRVSSSQVLQSIQERAAAYLRQIAVAFQIGNLGEGETVDAVTFDGIDVDPGGLVGDVHGNAGGSFVIPANVTTGIKEFRVVGGSGNTGTARFEGRGIITDIIRQQVTEITRWQQNKSDPLAQTFTLDQNRHISGIEVKFCSIGDATKPVICQIVAVDNGTPTSQIIAQPQDFPVVRHGRQLRRPSLVAPAPARVHADRERQPQPLLRDREPQARDDGGDHRGLPAGRRRHGACRRRARHQAA